MKINSMSIRSASSINGKDNKVFSCSADVTIDASPEEGEDMKEFYKNLKSKTIDSQQDCLKSICKLHKINPDLLTPFE